MSFTGVWLRRLKEFREEPIRQVAGQESGATLAKHAEERLSIEADLDQSVARLVLTGPIDLSNAEQLDYTLGQLLRSGPRTVVIDLRGVTDVDATGLRVLVAAGQEAEESGSRLLLHGDYLLRLRVALADFEGRYAGPG